jgi:hypothetical protein
MTTLRVAAAIIGMLLLPGPAQAAVSPDWASRWRADLSFLADTLPKVHPNLYHSVCREEFLGELDSLGVRASRLDHYQLTVELARIMARVGDGHTRLTLPFDTAARFFTGHSTTAAPLVPGLVFRQLPVRFGWFADGLFVVRAGAGHRDLLGGMVVTIGRLPVEQAMAAVEPTVHHDNPQQVRNLLPSYLVVPEILVARGVTDDMERVRLVVRTPGGKQVEVTLSPAAPGVAPEWVEAREVSPPLFEQEPGDRHWFQRISGTPIVYARYREVMDDPDETVSAFADSLFAAVGRGGADQLVIDIRGNVGGNGFLNRPILRGVIAEPSLSQPGKLMVLADRGTFSAAMMLLCDLEKFTPAVFVGETSGASPNGYGDSRRVRLPNTGLTVRVSTLFWQMSGPNDRRDGIPPHIAVEPRFADWRAGRDPVIDMVLALTRTASDASGEWEGTISIDRQRLPIAIQVTRSGSGFEVVMDIPALQLKQQKATGVQFGRGELAFAHRGSGAPWQFRVRVTPGAMVGVVKFQGADLPLVLARTSAIKPAGSE